VPAIDDTPTRSRITQTGLYLRELLLRPPYRRRWEQFTERHSPGEINQLAVAQVLAEHLWDYPRRDIDTTITARQLRHTVARAFSGTVLSRPTVSLFVEAFSFSQNDAERIWRLWEGSAKVRVLVGPRALPPRAAAAVGPTRHTTLALHEHHQIGADGLPLAHRTLQVIEAKVDGLDRYPYRFDTDSLTVEVGHGCKGLVGPLYEVMQGLYAVDIALSGPLSVGEQTTIEYRTHFHYTVAPKPEFRRGAQSRIESVDIAVQFHQDKLPKRIWWSVWDGIEGDVQVSEEASLDAGLAVQRYLGAIQNTVVGFRWAW
jgi:hypothetical protein